MKKRIAHAAVNPNMTTRTILPSCREKAVISNPHSVFLWPLKLLLLFLSFRTVKFPEDFVGVHTNGPPNPYFNPEPISPLLPTVAANVENTEDNINVLPEFSQEQPTALKPKKTTESQPKIILNRGTQKLHNTIKKYIKLKKTHETFKNQAELHGLLTSDNKNGFCFGATQLFFNTTSDSDIADILSYFHDVLTNSSCSKTPHPYTTYILDAHKNQLSSEFILPNNQVVHVSKLDNLLNSLQTGQKVRIEYKNHVIFLKKLTKNTYFIFDITNHSEIYGDREYVRSLITRNFFNLSIKKSNGLLCISSDKQLPVYEHKR